MKDWQLHVKADTKERLIDLLEEHLALLKDPTKPDVKKAFGWKRGESKIKRLLMELICRL